MRWKDFLYFQRGSKTAVILLLVLIVLTLILNALLSYRNSSDIILMQNDSLVREFDEFRRALTARDPSAVPVPDGDAERLPYRNFPADGNASRQGGGNGYSPRGGGIASPGAAYPFIRKLSEGETISLNGADTTEWKRIPGIGSAYASRIVKYRDLLGGFVHTGQLLEVYGIDQELFSRIAVYIEPDGNFRRIQVNRSEFRELLRHPYLNYKQVQAIMGLRRKKGDIASIRELSLLDEFTPEDIFRLEPYLDFR